MAGHLTVALIKPHVLMERNVGKIIADIEKAGFAILLGKMTQFSFYGAREFYREHEGKPFYDNLVQKMTAGPIWALVLHKENAVDEWRKCIGATNPAEAEPGTLRYIYGNHQNMTNNAVHGSASDPDAKRELNFFFSRDLTIAGAVASDSE